MPSLAVQEIAAPEYAYGPDAMPPLAAVAGIDPLIEAARLLLWQCMPSNSRPRRPDLSIPLEDDRLFVRRVSSRLA